MDIVRMRDYYYYHHLPLMLNPRSSSLYSLHNFCNKKSIFVFKILFFKPKWFLKTSTPFQLFVKLKNALLIILYQKCMYITNSTLYVSCRSRKLRKRLYTKLITLFIIIERFALLRAIVQRACRMANYLCIFFNVFFHCKRC